MSSFWSAGVYEVGKVGLLLSPVSPSPRSVLLFAIAAVVLTTTGLFVLRRRRLVSLIRKIPGPPSLPLLGNSIEMNVEHDELFERMMAMTRMWGQKNGIMKSWIGTTPYVLLSKPEVVERILGSVRHLEKSGEYVYLRPWLGTGLLTSSGSKWHRRRKILTPAFHFKILEDFIDVFQEQSEVLVGRLEGKREGEIFNIFPYVTLCTLDVVCETAMGRQVNAQTNSDSDYVKAVYEIGSIVQNRQAKVWLQPDWLFNLTEMSRRHRQCVKTLHDFSYKVIRERRETLCQKSQRVDWNENLETGRRKRLAFLDLLLEASRDGEVLTNEDIREEVDTFMFEGHDTTSAGISWTLFLLGSHPEIQELVYEELVGIFGASNRRATMKDLQEMRYLERCIKEALRLYPSVPMMARELREDETLAGYTVPAGTTAIIMTYMLHRNPEVFPNPEQFNPDNFLPERTVGRHPYAYIPFSAGPRNCIGQKFALLEEKSILSAVLRRFRVRAAERREELTLLGELILRPKDGLNVTLTERHTIST